MHTRTYMRNKGYFGTTFMRVNAHPYNVLFLSLMPQMRSVGTPWGRPLLPLWNPESKLPMQAVYLSHRNHDTTQISSKKHFRATGRTRVWIENCWVVHFSRPSWIQPNLSRHEAKKDQTPTDNFMTS